MAEKALKKLEEQLNCPVCLDIYTNPKLLQCHHVYCQKCLVRLVFQDQQGQLVVTCPNCRQVTPVPANGVAGLQSAFHINHLLEIQDSFKKIGAPTATREQSIGISTSDAPTRSVDRYCFEHPDEELKLYCETCEKLICLKCAIKSGKHHSHDYESLEGAYEKCKGEIESSLQPVEKQLSTVNEALAQLDLRSGEITSQQAAIEASIHESIDCLHEILDARRSKLIQDLHQIIQHKLKGLAVQKDHAETAQVQLGSCLQFMKESPETGCKKEMLLIKLNLAKQVKELTTALQTGNLKPKTEADVIFSATKEITSVCETFGQVHALGLPDPSKCHATGQGVDVAVIGSKSLVTLHSIDASNKACKEPIESLECVLVSDISDDIRVLPTIKRGNSYQYKISYQPTIRGQHQFHIKVDGQHIRGSPFTVTVIKKLGAAISFVSRAMRPLGVAINNMGKVVFCESNNDCVLIYLPGTGVEIRSLPAGFREPTGIACDSDGNTFVIDSYNKIRKIDLTGHLISTAGSEGGGKLQFKHPQGVAFNPQNRKVYIVDQNDRVQVLNSDLSFCQMFGTTGNGEGQFDTPCGIACDSAGRVYVADSGNHRVQVFTAEGEFLHMFGSHGKGEGQLNWPCGIAVDSYNVLYICDRDNGRIALFNFDGRFLLTFGKKGFFRRPGEFNSPCAIAVDRAGEVYVCDKQNCCLQVF